MSNSGRKRRRSSISSEDSYLSGEHQVKDRQLDRTSDRSIRKKFSEASPMARGRRRSRTRSRGRRPSLSSDNGSTWGDRKSLRVRSRSRSPHGRRSTSSTGKRHVDTHDDDSFANREPSRHQELFPSGIGPNSMKQPRDRSFSSDSLGRRRYSEVDERYGTSLRDIGRYGGRERANREAARRVSVRERSLSPFSKRLALTQSMNRGT